MGLCNQEMKITIALLVGDSTSSGKDKFEIAVSSPTKIKELFHLAAKSENNIELESELERFMVYYQGDYLPHGKAMQTLVKPGQQILLLPPICGG